MPIDIKYIGTQIRWPELSITGKQSVWYPGQEEERDDTEAGLLLATGLFQRSALVGTGLIAAQVAAGATGMVGVTATGKTVGPSGPQDLRGLPKNTLAVLGTSIEGLTLDATLTQYLADGALPVANAIMDGPWSTIDDYGVSGDTSGPSTTGQANPGFTARVATIVAGEYGWCWVGFPTNDVTNSLDADTFTIPNLATIYGQLQAAGCKLILPTGAPTSAYNFTGNGAYRNAYAKVQAYIRSYAKTNPGVVLVNTAMAITDPATGNPLTSPAVTKDGTHDNYEGAMRKALAISDAMTPLVKVQNTSVEALYDPRQYNVNPFMQGDNATGTAGFTNGIGASFTGTGPNGCGITKRNTGAGVGSRAAARSAYWKQPQQGFRMAFTATASWDGLLLWFGGDPTNAIGRYDQAWAATTAFTYPKRVNPTVANGFIYTLVTPGTTAGTEPTWGTTDGVFTTDGTVVWMAQKKPAAGDQFYAQVDIETSGLTAGKGGVVRLQLQTVDTTGTLKENVFANWVDLSNGSGLPARYLPPKMRLRTPILTMGSYTLRYVAADVACYGEAGASFNVDVFRADIIRVT